MGRTGTRLPGFCLNRIRPHVRVRSPPLQSKPGAVVVENSVKSDHDEQKKDENAGGIGGGGGEKPARPVIGRKVMIVVDSTLEAKGALQWALSHTVQVQDVVILLYVAKSSKQGEESCKEMAPKVYEFLHSMKTTCQLKRPEVHFEVATVEAGKDRGPAIVEEAKKQGVALLVLGQRKRSMTWRLMMVWAGNRVSGGVVEYCIQNAGCMAIAVRRKSKNLGGYLITTKRHKDFWLLA